MTNHLCAQDMEQLNPQDNIHQLESGKILYFPQYYFSDIDPSLMSEAIVHGTHKNVSYDYKRNKLGAVNKGIPDLERRLIALMRGYAEFSYQLIQKALSDYIPDLRWGRTSFRPAQISGRLTSKLKDDTRLHVDSFPATPVYGLRILRVFCNINPHQEPRVWHLGEPFTQVLQRFAPKIRPYNKRAALLLKWIKTTKTLRSPYDHYMLHLHDTMKRDDAYQAQVDKMTLHFPAHSSWIVFTDQVSHAAISGQYVLEQTFYLPVDTMSEPKRSPLFEWMAFRPELRSMISNEES